MSDEVDNLSIGTLSAAVAREVMGETPPESAQYVGDGRYYVDTDYSQVPWREEYWPREYAKDVCDAFLVVGRMRDRIGPTGFALYGVTDGRYECRMGIGSHASTRAFGLTAPEAICRAALRSARYDATKANGSEVKL